MGSYGGFGQREWADQIPLSSEQIRARSAATRGGGVFPLTESDIRAKLDRGENALELSIYKWEFFRGFASKHRGREAFKIDWLSGDIGSHTCSLCIRATDDFEREHGHRPRSSEDKCGYCPLARVDRCVDRGSAYKAVESLLESGAFGGSWVEPEDVEEFVYRCQTMVDQLRKARRWN